MSDVRRSASFVAMSALALYACATAVSSVSQDHVSIRYDVLLDSREKLQILADKECAGLVVRTTAGFGRRAIFQKTTKGEGLGLGYAHYACVE